MNTKHTPGPWSLETLPTSAGSCHKIGPFPGSAPHRREVHACVYADGIRIGLDERLPAAQELLANARLIATAPELLALAKEVADNVILAGMEIGQRARDLIAKATGEQA